MDVCKYCGRILYPGQFCDCPGAQQEYWRMQQNPAYYSQPPQPQPQQYNQPPQNPYSQNTPPPQTADLHNQLYRVRENIRTQDDLVDHQDEGFNQVQQGYYPAQQNQEYYPNGVPYQQPYIQKPPTTIRFFEFFTTYFKNPNLAAENAVKNKDIASIIICAVFYLFASAIGQLGIGIKLGAMQWLFPLFGFVFGLFGLVLPFVGDLIYTVFTRQRVNALDILGKVSLHTPITSFMLILTFLFTLMCPMAGAFMLLITTITYGVSLGSVWVSYYDKEKTNMLIKLLSHVIIFLFIVVFVVLVMLEVRCAIEVIAQYIEEYLYSSFLDNLF